MQGSSASTWSEIDRIVGHALELHPEDQPAYVTAACSGRPEIAAAVESLLRASAAAGDFLDPAIGNAPDACDSIGPPVPDHVGPYRLLEEVGHGGMSAVYRAERNDGQFQKAVAVKLLVTGWISPESLRRFMAERQILASLDHPNICHLMDAGTAAGVPYLVMEFIDGVPIRDYCREKALGERERLQLFCQICGAVQYAHQRLIAHRDIKPANVLVTRDGQVKLMDFGIAKVLAGAAGADQTQAGFGAMTPDYASPEQMQGGTVTTQTDIYSLGVLLYELLAGVRPYTASDKPVAEMLEIVSRAEPPAGGLPPELLAIARLAMTKAPQERYPSASALEEDVARYLSGQPVRAVLPSRWYTLRKWIGRHKLPVLAGAAAAMLVLVATAFALWSAAEARRERALAEQRFRDVRQLADKVLFDYPLALRQITASTGLQLRMATDSLQYLDSLSRAKNSDPEMLLDLAKGYVQIGVLLGTPRTGNLGQPEKALEAYRKAQAILEELLRRSPNLRPARHQLAAVLRRLSQLDKPNARKFAEQSVALWTEFYRQERDDDILFNLGWAHVRLAELDLQSGHALQAIECFQKFLAKKPNSVNAVHQQAYADRLLSRALLERNDAAGALAAAESAKTLDERARTLLSNNAAYTMEISIDLQLIATADLQANRRAAARQLFARVVDLRRQVLQSNPGDEWAQQQFLDALCWLGWIAERQGDWKEARSVYDEALKVAPTLAAAQPTDEWNTVLGFTYGSAGLLRKNTGAQAQVCAQLVKSAGYFRKVAKFEYPVFGTRAAEVERAAAICKP